ncbi:GNAT family N-acetyltransferase [Pseudopedobacter sp.]|uniref:GNAT family N-acetyltransferase n=1 Tax=Pseudopedobacter sp. TaxID=1936787 RepID=UPI003340042B
MKIKEVLSTKDIKQFLEVSRIIYANDKMWVCPLDIDIEAVFSSKKNSFHQHGKATRWILFDDNGKLIGRIAAFINYKKAHSFEKATGGIGFVECIDNEAAFTLLFDTAKKWLQNHGMEAMMGPINFGENDSFWGLLIDGFTHPSFGMNYHKPYYKKHFDNYGFKTMYEQITNHLDVNKPFPERFTKIAKWVSQKDGYTFEHYDDQKFNKFAHDFMEIYNDAWKDFDNFSPIKLETVIESFQKMKLIMDPKLIWFAYVNDEPASFIIILPDANQMIKPLKGKLGFIEKLRFLYYRYKGATRMRAIVMGTKEKFQKHGLESALFIKLKEYVLPLNQYQELELSWVGDFNDKMLAIHEATGADFGKKHATMLCTF